MAQLVVRHLEDEVKAGLRGSARPSTGAAWKRRFARSSARRWRRRRSRWELGSRIASYFAEVGFEDGIEELRSGPCGPRRSSRDRPRHERALGPDAAETRTYRRRLAQSTARGVDLDHRRNGARGQDRHRPLARRPSKAAAGGLVSPATSGGSARACASARPCGSRSGRHLGGPASPRGQEHRHPGRADRGNRAGTRRAAGHAEPPRLRRCEYRADRPLDPLSGPATPPASPAASPRSAPPGCRPRVGPSRPGSRPWRSRRAA